MVWRVVAYDFGGTDTVLVTLADGPDIIEVMADVSFHGRAATLRGLHVQGAGPHSLGLRRLIGLKNWAKEYLDVDELRIEGATRTSGASPGRIPPPLVSR